MKKCLYLFLLLFSVTGAWANHITGGEMYYVLVSQSGNNYTYRVTLKLYRDCNAPPNSAQLDPTAAISIFSNANFLPVWNGSVPMSTRIDQNLTSPGPCIQNPPVVCYQVGYYEFTITLPGTPQGYTITYQRCCRIAGINNLFGSNSVGATYTAQIPGTSSLPTGPANNSARFLGKDTVIVCANNYFCYDWGATDSDGDSLSYDFCTAYIGGTTGAPAPNPPNPPPYQSVPYSGSFSSGAPLGPNVKIDPKTGMMCGTAPALGIYVVTVCVTEWRNGIAIAVQRKDLQIKVGDCNLAASVPIVLDINGAVISPDEAGCKSFTFNFKNNVPPNPLIRTYYWEFGDGGTSTDAVPVHTFNDTGVYNIKLVINRGEECGDSTNTILKVYPGFSTGFDYSGICFYNPTNFIDTSTSVYGTINYWKWDFGKPSVSNDTSRLRNPSYNYGLPGTYDASLIVKTSKGCVDTVKKQVTIIDKPVINLAFRDTLICRGDTLRLKASGIGNFSWLPNSNISATNVPDPVVNPPSTAIYKVQLDDSGCINTDSVQVRVITFVTLNAMADTTICATDPVQLTATTDGLRFLWSPSANMNDPTVLSPIVQPPATTTYRITATVGSCSATDSVRITLVPYPVANAGSDQAICYGSSAQLNGSIVGSTFNWSPTNTITGAGTLSPVASPLQTTAYVLTVYDTIGCPKPGRDTVVVNVFPKINANAGRDTAVVINQPLQLLASGGVAYQWSPVTGLSRSNIANPVAMYDGSFDSIRYTVTVYDENGCSATTEVAVKIFKTNPQIFVPSAFTPNGDGLNDVVRPIAVGLTKIDYFRIYNRWGQLVFSTTRNGQGWDGKIKGQEQGSATFVWVAGGEDFTGKKVSGKGTVTLIR